MFQLVLLRLLESYFRHRWLNLLPVVIMFAVAAVYPTTVKPTYVAAGNIYIQSETLLATLSSLQNTGFGWVSPSQATAAEIGQVLNANAFMRAVVQQTDLAIEMTGDPYRDNRLMAQVRSSIWAAPLGHNLLSIGARHEDPRVAHQLATSVINTYLQWKINLRIEGSTAAQNFFVELRERYGTELEPARQELTAYLTAHPVPLRGERPADEAAEIARLQAVVDQALARVRDAEAKEENARLAMIQTESDVRQTYFTIDPPVVPTRPEQSRRQMALVMMICVVAGFALTAVAVAGGALLDRTQRFPIDVRHGFSLPVLAQVPEIRKSRKGKPVNVPAANARGARLPAVGVPVGSPVAAAERRPTHPEPLPAKAKKAQGLFGYK